LEFLRSKSTGSFLGEGARDANGLAREGLVAAVEVARKVVRLAPLKSLMRIMLSSSL